eukprot:INCI18110.4.p1 GENE.INCI18110.4~~INCI18110.4.p1  ORF type:complete len:501 (+),score=76.97 INCI18110.4:166-1668(+)
MYFPTVGGSFISNPGHVSDDRFMRVVNSRARSLPPPTRNPDVFFPTVEDSFVRSPSPVRSLRLDTSEPAQNRPGSVHARDHGVKKKRRENSALLLVPYDKKVSRKQGQRSSATSGHRESCAVGNGTRSQARSELKSAAKISSPISSRTLHSSRVTPQQSKLTRSHATERPVSMPDAAANSTAKKKAAKHRYQFGGVREQERQTKVQAAAQRAQERRMEEQRRFGDPRQWEIRLGKHRTCFQNVESGALSIDEPPGHELVRKEDDWVALSKDEWKRYRNDKAREQRRHVRTLRREEEAEEALAAKNALEKKRADAYQQWAKSEAGQRVLKRQEQVAGQRAVRDEAYREIDRVASRVSAQRKGELYSMYSRFLDEIAMSVEDESDFQTPSTSPSSGAALRLQQLREAKQTPSFTEWYDKHRAEQEREAARRATEFKAQMVEKLTSKFSEAGLLDRDVAQIISDHQGDYWKVDKLLNNADFVALFFCFVNAFLTALCIGVIVG